MSEVEIRGHGALHFLWQAVALVEEREDEGVCPDEEARDRYLALAQVEATIGLALAVLSKGEALTADTADPPRPARTSRQGIDLTVTKIGERR